MDIVKIYNVQNVFVSMPKRTIMKDITIKDIVRIKNSKTKYRVQDIKYIGFSSYLLLENIKTYEVIEVQNNDLIIKVK